MFDTFIKFVIKHNLLIFISTAALVVAGIVAWKNLPIDAFPDVTNVQVMVLTEAPGLAPVDVEQQVTFPMEKALQGLPGVTQVRSLSKASLSQVIVVFDDGVDTYFARQLVFMSLQSVREQLPLWANPEMGPISTGLGEIYQYTLESPDKSPMELRTLQDWLINPQLQGISGVNEVNSMGGFVKQYHVVVDPPSLQKYGLSLSEVLESIECNNATVGGDFIVQGWEQSYVRSIGTIKTIDDIRNIVLKAKDGAAVYLRDIAKVVEGPQIRQGAVTRDGKGETVAGMVIMLRGENSKIVVDRVKKAIPAIQASLPKDVKISPFYDRTELIQACIKTISDSLLLGGFFVIIVLFLLLGNFRTALIVALSLPLSALIAFLLMKWQGVTANLMSLGGLAIALGMVVDASIVVCENIHRHLTERDDVHVDKKTVVFEAVREVGKPVIFAILIIIVVLLPLFTLEQMEGKMFKPLALTMGFVMLGSLIVALTIVPALSYKILKGKYSGKDNTALKYIIPSYLKILDKSLRNKKITMSLAVMALLCSLMLLPFIGTEFLPQLNEGAIAINVVRLPSAALDGSVKVGTLIEQRLMKFPEVSTIVSKTGRAEISEDPMGPEQSDIFIMLKPQKEWKTGRSKEELVQAMQKDLASIPGIRPSFSQPIALRVNELISGIKSDLALKLFGPDLDVLKERANSMAAVLGDIKGAQDVKIEQISGFSQIEIIPDRLEIAKYKINVQDINDLIETAVGGKVATYVIENQMRFAAQVRFPEEYRNSIEELKRLLVPAPDGITVPLGQLAEIREVDAPAQINRENAMRRVVVECNIRGRDLGSFIKETQEKIGAVTTDLPTGYFIKYGGQFENQQRAMKRLAIVVPLSIMLIFIMLFMALGKARSAFMVLTNLLFALAGGILSIFLLRINLSVSVAIGLIVLFGTAVSNGVILVSFFDQLMNEGLNPDEAVRKGCKLRFRPLLMTTISALLGLLPMIFATGSGSELQRPLAIVVMGGMTSAFVLTTLVLPSLYVMVETHVLKKQKV